MVRRRKSAMGRKLAAIAAAPGVRDAIHINVWTEDAEGEPKSEAGPSGQHPVSPRGWRRAAGSAEAEGEGMVMNNNRCMFIAGIGRVHVIGPLKPEAPAGRLRDAQGRFRYPTELECGPAVAVADAPPFLEDPNPKRTMARAMLAADIIAGIEPGRIVWSVRFAEKGTSSVVDGTYAGARRQA